VEADPRLLEVLLRNLLDNAWKFTAKEPQARIELGCLRNGEQREFFVRDNGAGFDMAYADKLFGAFQRLHRQQDFPGTGIGLATVQRIVARHGGRIRAEGAPGAGATFFFTL
jgi:light-regulated signal transduction histidine kinase (bacteriophytochrome)